MVISFSHDMPWRELVEEGEVITFRKSRRARPNCTTWCNRGRGKTKEFDVEIKEIGEVEPSSKNLKPYAGKSGFGSVSAWREAIADLNGNIPATGYLYRVTPVNDATAEKQAVKKAD